ncbi:YeiH family protein [Aneurinibacillus sp. REN35]|uniref:YeiH family protein n=1 Tax=Aneurinibacillus sp. REN35 TaxID=3237286 RepID=UPI003526E572
MIREPVTTLGQGVQKSEKKKKPTPFMIGIGITLAIAVAAKYIALLPGLGIIGPLVIAILLGMVWRAALPIPEASMGGIHFASKKLLRVGIIFLGMRLNLYDIVEAGPKVFAIAALDLAFALVVVYALCRLCKVDRTLGILTACGTAICGAAAVAAISSQVKANEKETAIGVATIAVLGTIFTLGYSLLYPFLGFSAYEYGVFTGGTLHEIAHVVAAGAAGGQQAMDISIIVKLTRVALLVPVALLVGWWFMRRTEDASGNTNGEQASLSIPWFILGFLLLSGINTLGIIPAGIAAQFVALGYLLIAMAMAGLGLNIDAATFKRMGVRPFWAGLIGSFLLSVFGYALVYFIL